jgi:hypothetical protein
MIVNRLEKPCFELAVFGRVSSGKSSLLNHIAGLDVLPVGVTPVTAVPTRLEHGDESTAVVSFSESTPRRIDVKQLWEYASEEGNQSLAEASLRRKIASLSESVATSLESLRLRSGASENSQVEGLAEPRRLFDEADEAIRRARQQLLDWSMLRERVLELILQLAAQSAGAEEQSSSARDDRLFHVARKILAERAGMAQDLVAGLEQSLRGSLDGLRRAEPLPDDIIASRADGKPAGLPVPDLCFACTIRGKSAEQEEMHEVGR